MFFFYLLLFFDFSSHAPPPQGEQDATISFYGYAIAPLAGLADPALADGSPLSLPELPITIVHNRSRKGPSLDSHNVQATVLLEARRLGGDAAVKAAEAREKRLSQSELLPSIAIQAPTRTLPLPGSATPPQLEEGRMDSLRLKQAERENHRLKREIALLKVLWYPS